MTQANYRSNPNQGVPNQGVPNQGVPNQGVPNQGVPNQGNYRSNPNQGVPHQANTKFDAKKITLRITKIFDFLIDIVGIIFHILVNLAMLIWNVLMTILLSASRLVSLITASFSMEIVAALWVGLAIAVSLFTLLGWWYMGGRAAMVANSVLNLGINPNLACWISLAVGFFLNAQQVQTQIWTMSKNVAAMWDKASGGKTDVKTAGTDYSKYLTAKVKRDTLKGQFLEFVIQFLYATVLNLNFFTGAIYILASIFIPEMVIKKAAIELNMIKLKMYG